MKLRDTRTPEIIALAGDIKFEMSKLVIAHSKVVEANHELSCLLRNSQIDAVGMLLTGPAGMGKTNYSQAIVRYMTSNVTHTIEADKRPVILIESPDSSARGGMASQLLIALGDNNPYAGNLTLKIEKIANYLIQQDVKLIIIDEIHGFLPKKPTTLPSQALTFLKRLMNCTKVPFLFMGTELAKPLVSNDAELASRILYRVAFECIPFGQTISDKKEFTQILDAYAQLLSKAGKNLIFIKKEKDKKKLNMIPLINRIYLATQGNLRNVRNLFQGLVDIVLEGDSPDLASFSRAWRPAMNITVKFNPFDEGEYTNVKKKLKITE